MNIRVRGDRVLIRPEQLDRFTDAGLEVVSDHTPQMIGVVVAVGDGPVTGKGVRMEHLVQPGDRVIFPPQAGEELFFETDVILSMKETDILCVVDAKTEVG